MFLLPTYFGAPKPICWYHNVSSTGFCVTPDQTALSHLSRVTYVSLTAQKQYFFEILYILVTYILGAPKPIWWYLNVSCTGFCVTPDQTALSHLSLLSYVSLTTQTIFFFEILYVLVTYIFGGTLVPLCVLYRVLCYTRSDRFKSLKS